MSYKIVQLKVDVCPSEILSLTNKVILNPKDIANLNQAKHVRITTGPGENQQYIFSVEPNDKMLAGRAGFSKSQREWIDVEVNQDVIVYVHNPDSSKVVSSPTARLTLSTVYNGNLKFQTSVSLRNPLHGSRNLAYIACKMDSMCQL